MPKQGLGDAPDRTQRKNPIPVWQGQEYAKHERGERIVRVHEVQGPEWVRQFQRWSVRVGAHLMDERGEVSCFLNLGNRKEAPYVGRRSRYYKAWSLANGGPPHKGEPMSADIFLDKCFLAVIEDSTLGAELGENHERKPKPAGEVYSIISELRELVYSPLHPPIKNQESINQESAKHPIKQSTNQDCHRGNASTSAPAGRGFTPSKPKSGVDLLRPAQAIASLEKATMASGPDINARRKLLQQQKQQLRAREVAQ